VRLSARVLVEPIWSGRTHDSKESLCELRIDQPKISHYDQSEDNYVTGYSDSALQARLLTPLYFMQLNTGRIVEIFHLDGDPAWVINLKRGILSALQVTHGLQSGSYSVEETDVTGTCDVRYAVGGRLPKAESSTESTTEAAVLTLQRTKDYRDCDRHARGGSEHTTQDIHSKQTAEHHLHAHHRVLVSTGCVYDV
jgi:hypothetical protein